MRSLQSGSRERVCSLILRVLSTTRSILETCSNDASAQQLFVCASLFIWQGIPLHSTLYSPTLSVSNINYSNTDRISLLSFGVSTFKALKKWFPIENNNLKDWYINRYFVISFRQFKIIQPFKNLIGLSTKSFEEF